MHTDEKHRNGQEHRDGTRREAEAPPVIPSVIALPPPPGYEPEPEVPEEAPGALEPADPVGVVQAGDEAQGSQDEEREMDAAEGDDARYPSDADPDSDDDDEVPQASDSGDGDEGLEATDPGSLDEPDEEGDAGDDDEAEAEEEERAVLGSVADVGPGPSLRRHHVAPALIPLDRVLDDPSLRIRPEGDVSLLATDIARLGQLTPVDVRLVPPDRFQIICGFRRVAALRFLHREKVLARLHTDLTDDDALLLALAAAIHAKPVEPEELEALRDRLERERRLTPLTRDMLEKALSSGENHLAPENVGENGELEIDADELAVTATLELGKLNQDLALLAGVFESLDQSKRAELLQQLRYSADLVAFLEGK